MPFGHLFKVQEKQTNKRPYDQILLYIDLPMVLRIMHRYSNVPVKIKHNVILRFNFSFRKLKLLHQKLSNQ